ncbi:unnamed protein product [Rhizophagus irregularis]|uniref:Uncharacterized protein n=1 Tax=Rhizophagus irregularis TaxID=588596 RepID=A0A916EIL2_9GLOM|nr:unnamed protein product [Rhizophagus irregularis]CAB5212839.1 unnamed protein product [Rhizophagus irregularis]CAB5385837.1 unnamed protein product [Rhizophagus irregularis]
MANAGLTVRKETIQKQKIRLANSHQQTVKDYIIDNKNNLIILNVDDYHNIHTLRRPDTTTTSSALHFRTILMKSSLQAFAIPFKNDVGQSIQNPEGIDFERTERLLIHSYDIRIAERKKDRSMQNTKLIDLLEGSLHSTEDYISVIRLIINIPELCAYLEENILIAPMDYP